MSQFLFQTTRNLLVELGSSTTKLPGLVRSSGRRALVVTDKPIRKLGLLDASVAAMEANGVDVHIYDGVQEDPSTSVVFECTKVAQDFKADVVIGFGGGSSMDTAKIAAVLSKSDQSLEAMYGVGNIKAGVQRLPLIQVPTTSGTGSEVTPITIITTEGCEKKGVVDPLLLPDWAVLDGDLTVSVPKHVTSATGIDAMVHAIEAYTSKIRKNVLADAMAVSALKLLGNNIVTVCEDPANRQARSDMLLGSCFAGIAFANSPVAAVHALAYPIGSHFHVPHGLSNALMLPHVMRANMTVAECSKQYAELAPYCLPGSSFADSDEETAAMLADGLAQLAKNIGMKTTLREVGIADTDIPLLASESMKQQRLLINNPREMTLELATELYTSAY
eukprot:TRINITY_DN7974_c0_g1_i1.p1 TRINITY_DN7974_c0_g1~~TRINITY_DN7974_c0_g1_i1.p1  ORF type:complete len:390 (+),score=131.13 TRINITY_DN7974_c0_g1_i1:38-1207(+)